METVTLLQTIGLYKSFDDRVVIDNLNIAFEKGKIYSILAPSGIGKTTFLKIVAGLDENYEGEIKYNFDKQESPIGFIFQESSIFPWLTVRENLAFGLKIKNQKGDSYVDINRDVDLLSKELDLVYYLDYYPNKLSGGLKQRVAFGRSLILKPKLLLCDEPFTSLDEKAREEMQLLLLKIQKLYDLTVLFVTHNIDEAIILADTLLVFNSGLNMDLHNISLSHLKDVNSKNQEKDIIELSCKIKNYFHKEF